MAIIHKGKNDLKEKLENYYEQEVQRAKAFFYEYQEEQKQQYEAKKLAHRKSIPVKLALVLLAIGLILLLVLCPGILSTLQDGARGLFTGLENALGDAIRNDMMADSDAGLGKLLLNLVIGFFQLIAAVLLWLLRVSSGVLVFLLCFSIPLLIAYFAIKGLAPLPERTFDRTFDEEAEREQVREGSLPDEMNIIKSGLEGEEAALELLSRLGDSCHIYTNLRIPYEGKESETDVIVVAPHTVTIVEVKNYKDDLSGDWSDEHLTLEAERGDTTHRKEIYNPVRQVATHVYRLSNYLRERGVAAAVNRCVLFIDSSVFLHMMKDADNVLAQCPVFKAYEVDDLFDYLQKPQKGTAAGRVVPLLNQLVTGDDPSSHGEVPT